MKLLLLPIILILTPICSIVLRTLIRMGDEDKKR